MKSLLAALFPSDCRFCQASLYSLSRLPVCDSCIESIQPIERPRCNVCGDLLLAAESAFGDACCRSCSVEAPAYARAVNYGAYTGVLRQLVHLLKYGRVRPAAAPLARLTAEACLQLEGDIDVPELLMIPVPAHKLRLRTRGFNQAELIARLARPGIEEAIQRRVVLDSNTMLRVRFFDSQVALTAEERHRQIRGSFKVVARERVKGREVLLVDDVLTTGATASECARELRQAGAARVWVVTPARSVLQEAQIENSPVEVAAAATGVGQHPGIPSTSLIRRLLPPQHANNRRDGEPGLAWRLIRPSEFPGITVTAPESGLPSVSSLVNTLAAPAGLLRRGRRLRDLQQARVCLKERCCGPARSEDYANGES